MSVLLNLLRRWLIILFKKLTRLSSYFHKKSKNENPQMQIDFINWFTNNLVVRNVVYLLYKLKYIRNIILISL